MKRILLTILLLCIMHSAFCIEEDVMQRIYQEVRTPYKYGMVIAPADNYHKIDCPTVFREGDTWYMTYVCYNGKEGLDGRGYETWLAKSEDLLHWQTLGRILAYPADGANLWDQNQRGGFPALIDYDWNGSYQMFPYKGRHYMTYIGGSGTGYEAVNAPLSIGIAHTANDITKAHQWDTQPAPLMSYNDKDAQWWEQLTQYKSTIYWIKDRQQRIKGEEKYPFVMFYNAGGKDDTHPKGERIGIALSKDMKRWKRYSGNPVFAHDSDGTITGDAQIVRMDDLWVMFYFSAFNPTRKYNAYNTFAVSRDLVHWQDWTGEDLIIPSKPYDEMFAHKSYVVKHDGIVYHFYCAVNNDQQRGIAVATSMPMGRSEVSFPAPERKGRRGIKSLNEGWTAHCLAGRDTIPTTVNLPHNFDDYYGYRQLRHGNLHGSAIYQKSFALQPQEGKRYFLQLEGVGTYATITLNDTEYPKELIGRTVFTLDVTEALNTGKNTLHILVDHPAMQTESPWVCGGCSSEWGFSEGSQPFGIFRPVTLIETDAVRIEPFGVHIWNNAACDSVFIDTEIKNYTQQPQQIEVVNKFAKASGKQVFRHATPITVKAGETIVIRHSEKVEDVQRWSLEDPYLYTLTSMIKRDGKTTDEVRTPFGIRNIKWGRQFFLNGKPTFINGTCEYEHLLGNSHAFTPEQIRSRIKQITNAGFNAFREAHQPHNLLYQQLLDEQGILFWSQFSAHIWYDTPAFRENFKRLLVRWIKERRNSPSVILWGLQNESILPKDFAEECSDIIRKLDPTCGEQRLITTCNGGEGTDWNVIQNWSGTYGGSADNYDNELKGPDQLLNGEYGAWRTIDLHGDAKYSEESFTKLLETKARLAEKAFADASGKNADNEGICGHFQWIFNSHDNPGRVQPDGAYRRIDKIGPINYKGLITTWEEPTPAYYMYRHRYATVPEGSPSGPLPTAATPATVPEGSPSGSLPTPADRNIDLLKAAEGYNYLYRINCGGDAFIDEFGQQWQADDTLYSHSWGQDYGMHPYQASQRHISEDIRGTNSDELFQFFRFGRHRLWYDFPVSGSPVPSALSPQPSVHSSGVLAAAVPAAVPATMPAAVPATVPEGSPSGPSPYRIELYFTEPWHGKEGGEQDDYEGMRIFDVAVNDSLVINDLDPWAEAGYCGAMKRVIYATAKDGRIRISFPEVKAGQAIICGIAIATINEPTPVPPPAPVGESAIPSQTTTDSSLFKSPSLGRAGVGSWRAFDTDTIAKLPKAELPQDTEARPATVYQPVAKGKQPSSKSGTTFAIKPGLGQEYALRFRYKNTTGSSVKARMTITDSKRTTLVDREITFPTTPNKFKMLSTTTGTQINAGTYTVKIHTNEVEFKEIEIQ